MLESTIGYSEPASLDRKAPELPVNTQINHVQLVNNFTFTR